MNEYMVTLSGMGERPCTDSLGSLESDFHRLYVSSARLFQEKGCSLDTESLEEKFAMLKM